MCRVSPVYNGAFIQATNITLVFKPKDREPVAALEDFSLKIIRGELVSVVGPSGCGKSAFLNIRLWVSCARSIAWSLTQDLSQWPRGLAEKA